MTDNRNGYGALFAGVDKWTVTLYVILTLVGFASIFSASYDPEAADAFSLSHFYMKQVVWLAVAWTAALVVILIDDRYYYMLAMPAYVLGIVALIAVLLFGREVNGARAWFEIGSVRIQPVEFVKIAIALALAHIMSRYSFSISSVKDLSKVVGLLLLPLAIIVMQNDTGSGLVLCSFLFVLYREGLNKWLCIPVIAVAVLFVVSFIVSPLTLLVMLIAVCVFSEAMMNGMWRSRIIYLASIAFVSLSAYVVLLLLAPGRVSYYVCLLVTVCLSLAGIAVYAYRTRLRNIYILLVLFAGSMVFLPTTDYIFSSVLKEHQRFRILSFLGLMDDPLGSGYNVNQAKIAIGSGGFLGKGYMKGTQIRYNFVPEKHTDFIFCTIGEEEGFWGAVGVLLLFGLLILRLMKMGERQHETFGRVYCYSVASVMLFHLIVNVGMTIGLMPVMGIPLPFISYGGSSLIAFTVLLFIAVRLDASTRRGIDN